MKGLLTSFGLLSQSDHPSFFYRLPPLSANGISSFGFDYTPLLFYDSLIIDEGGLARLRELNRRHSTLELPTDIGPGGEQMLHEYRKVLLILDLLEKEGILVSRNFERIISERKACIEEATLDDMRDPYAFCRPLLKSMELWTEEIARMRSEPSQARRTPDMSILVGHGVAASKSLDSWVIKEGLLNWKQSHKQEVRAEIRNLLKHYLSYINLNLEIARNEGAVIIDWEDMAPIYSAKFTGALDSPSKNGSFKRIFQFFFPDWAPNSPKELVKVLRSPALNEFKALIAGISNENQDKSAIEALKILRDIINIQSRTAFRRKVTGNIGKLAGLAGSLLGPIGSLIATGAVEGGERVVDKTWSERPLDQYKWFFMINGIRASNTDEEQGDPIGD